MWNQKLAIDILKAKSGFKNKDLAKKIGVSEATIINYRNGIYPMSIETAELLAGFNGSTLEEFISWGR